MCKPAVSSESAKSTRRVGEREQTIQELNGSQSARKSACEADVLICIAFAGTIEAQRRTAAGLERTIAEMREALRELRVRQEQSERELAERSRKLMDTSDQFAELCVKLQSSVPQAQLHAQIAQLRQKNEQQEAKHKTDHEATMREYDALNQFCDQLQVTLHARVCQVCVRVDR